MSLCRSNKSDTQNHFMIQHSFLILHHPDFCCCSIDKSRVAAARFLLPVWSCTSVGFAEFLTHTGDDDAGVRRWFGGGGGVSTTDRFAECAHIQVISTESGVTASLVRVRLTWVLSFWDTNLTVPSRAEPPSCQRPCWRSERAELRLAEGADGELFVVHSSIIHAG